MPTCFCTSYGCASLGGVDPVSGQYLGKKVDSRVFKIHSIEDKKAYLAAAEQRTETAVDAQIEEITAHLSACVLADQVSGPSSSPGGSLWDRDLSENRSSESGEGMRERSSTTAPNSSVIPPHCPPRQPRSRRSKEESIISCLAVLQVDLDKVYLEADQRLAQLGRPSSSCPFPLLDLLKSTNDLQERLDVVTYKSPAVLELRSQILSKLQILQTRLRKAKKTWTDDILEIKDWNTPVYGLPFDTGHHFKPILKNVDPILQVLFFMVMACQILLGVSRRGCNFLLRMVRHIIQMTLSSVGPCLTRKDQNLLDDIATDPRTFETAFSIENQRTILAICPNPHCHFAYEPNFKKGSPVPFYPDRCSHRAFKGGRKCDTPLLKTRTIEGQFVSLPIKPFVAFSLKDWLAGILSRNGFEESMDHAWTSCRSDNHPTEMSDIFHGRILREFKGPDGQHFSAGGEEGRYVFSLCVDFFNPLGNKQAGKKKSIGLVSLVCLNLPPDKRYKPENMFLYGIIPGPNEPPLACLNHYLTHLVDELLEFWFTGVRFSRTSTCEHGRVIRCAIVCVVSDLPAARKVNGFASLKHVQMCAMCHCRNGKEDPLNDAYTVIGERRSKDEIQASAELYLKAADSAERKETVGKTGIRWSELHRLPYFDPSKFVVVDAMHNLFLGLVQEHFEILGIRMDNSQRKQSSTTLSIDIGIPEEAMSKLNSKEWKSLTKLLSILKSPMSEELTTAAGHEKYFKRLNNFHRIALQLVYESLGLKADTHAQKTHLNKPDFTRAILSWRSQLVEESLKPAEPLALTNRAVLTTEELHSLRIDIANMITPSWLTAVPSNLGNASHGKLKADQWRTLGTTYLPVSLIRLWECIDTADDRSRACKKLLATSLSLISAVIIASSRKTSKEKAELYFLYMQNYLKGLRELFPGYRFLPNQHMALHLAEYLQLYGPVHAWWTFPFERLIGLLQRIPNNFQIGKLEETLSTSFNRSANLRAMLYKSACPEAIRMCDIHLSKLVDPQVRNTLLTDISHFLTPDEDEDEAASDSWTGPAKVIPEGPYKALQAFYRGARVPLQARSLSHYTHNGLMFSTHSRHPGNSHVLIRRQSLSSVPARIDSIFQLPTGEIIFVIRHFLRTTANDPFLKYPVIRTSLWSQDLGRYAVVRADDIECHFAALFLSWQNSDCMAAISLSRVVD